MSSTQLSTTTKTHLCSRVVSTVKSTVAAHPRVAVATAVVTAGGVVYYYRHWLAERTFRLGESVWRLYTGNSKGE